ncbi:formate/nitrite transporter family protein [Paracoccus rhizosphaerae]|uniref:Formate/nitrite transporter family protein n=1 Tax=Paracoccus rhizosphaerae TaxID=1133347 RepID=A0ABV6CL42_9RHOB|nr:formate/nitrite transporter family protein [Paracoccus rhizosphaerae]
MSYVNPTDFAKKMIDSGVTKVSMSTKETLIRAYMAGAILTLAAAFAVTVTVNTRNPLIGTLLFPAGFSMLYLLGFDLLTGVFTLVPLALIDRRRGVTPKGMLRNWRLVFCGNFAGAFTVAIFMAIIVTFGWSEAPNAVGEKIGHIGEGRTVGCAAHGAAGMLTLFVRAGMCNWMGSTSVVAVMMSTSVSVGNYIVNMFLFPAGLLLGGNFTIGD